MTYEHLNRQQFGEFTDKEMNPSKLISWANQDIDIDMAHRDQVAKLVDSMLQHGYRPEMADEPIQVLTHGKKGAVLEGQHRVWAAHYAGLPKVPVRARKVDKKTWTDTFGE